MLSYKYEHFVGASLVILSMLVPLYLWNTSTNTSWMQSTVVLTTSGPVRGYLQSTLFEHRPYYAFKGIPYAEPPTGSRRFLPPFPVGKWSKIHDCSAHGPNCVQLSPHTNLLSGNENCLHLNVYTPGIPSNIYDHSDLPPIMIFMHGGAFFYGNSDDTRLGPDFLINENVILVTFNYRLGVMGFLALNSTQYSGNAGLKDQQLALQWVHDNALAFGGDHKRITLFGSSSGSYSSQLHMRSEVSKKLIKRVIFMSNSFDLWSMFNRTRLNHDVLTDFVNEKTHIAKNNVTFNNILQCLQTVSAYELVERFTGKTFHRYAYLRIERENDSHPFITGTTDQVLFKSDLTTTTIDVMSGLCSSEAIVIKNKKTFRQFLIDHHIKFPNVHFTGQYNHAVYPNAVTEVLARYFPKGLADDQETYEQYIRLMSDTHQNYFIDQRVRLLAANSKGKTFFYQFGLETQLNYAKSQCRDPVPGASHGDEQCYIFCYAKTAPVYSNLTTSTHEYTLMKMMSRMYADFARCGNPLPGGGWPAVRPNQQSVMDISMDGLRILDDPFKSMHTFWSDLMDKYSNLTGH